MSRPKIASHTTIIRSRITSMSNVLGGRSASVVSGHWGIHAPQTRLTSIKILSFTALAVLMAVAFFGTTSASATILCTADEDPCAAGNLVTSVHEASVGKAKLLTSFGTVECNVLFATTKVGGAANPQKLEGNFTYTNCQLLGGSCTFTEENGPAEILVNKEGHETAKITGERLAHLVCGSSIDCSYNGVGLVGTAKGPLLAIQANGEVTISEQTMTKEAGSFLCPKTTKLDLTTTPLTATYIVTTGTPPSKPSVTSVDPGSPANNNSPSLIGSATAGSTVQLFTNSSCSGSPVASGSATAFGSTGIAASVADNSTTTFYANAINGAGSSPCSTTSVTYVEDSAAPAAPTVSSTSPASGSNDNAPKVIGSAESSSTVKLYTNATCTSTVAATGTATAFASPGLAVSVADNTTTSFYATATDAAGNVSACSSTSVTYVEATPKVYWGAWLGGNAYSTGEKTYGDGPWDSETWNLFEKHTGKKISIEHFGQPAPWNQAFAEGPLNLTRERGAIPLMDMDPDGVTLKEIVEGKKDSDFKTWAKAVKAWGYPMFFRWTWEMNGTWFQWGKEAAANPTLYKEAWWHLHDLVEEQGASNVTWVWCPNLTFSGSTSLSSLYPGKESEGKGKYVDWTCLDGYNFGTNPKKSDSWKSFSTLYTSSYNELLSLAPTKPIMIGEMSSTEYGGSKASWITDAIGTQIPENFSKIKAVVWYNKWDGELDWPIETSSSSESAFASAIASTYYAGNTFGGLPALTKVEPLP